MEKDVNTIEKAQELKSELEQFKEQQKELLKKMEEQNKELNDISKLPELNHEHIHDSYGLQDSIDKVKQLSPASFELGDISLPSSEQELLEIEEKAKKAVQQNENNYKDYTSQINTNSIKPTINSEKLSKADLALLTLEEEILSDSVEIYLPGIKENIIIKPLKSIEELNLKTQKTSFATFLRQLNVVLMTKTHIKNIPLTSYYKTVEEFESKILPVDRILLIFGIIKNSFEKLAEFPMQCENCQKEFISTPNVKNLNFNFNLSKDEIINTDFYNLKFTKIYLNGKLEIDYGFNPEAVRMNLTKFKSNNEIKENIQNDDNILDSIDNLILFIKRIRVYKLDKRTKEGKKLVTEIDYYQDGFNEVFKFIHDMPMKIRDNILINTDLLELEKYSPIFKINETCPYCGHVHEMDNSPEIEFFRKALSLLA